MSLLVVRPGLFTTVQDLGRPGHRQYGVPVGGAFDRRSHALANALAGNDAEPASLELTVIGGVYRAVHDLALGLAGAEMSIVVERGAWSRTIPGRPGSFTLRQGETLLLGPATQGTRTYLAVRGGWRVPPILGSRSAEKPLQAGFLLPAEPGWIASRWTNDPQEASGTVRVVHGPDFGELIDGDPWEGRDYLVTPVSDRVGIRLLGPPIRLRSRRDRLSAPVLPGAIQVAGGQPLLLGVACGTMGGYPHVGQVISADLSRVGQLRPGETVRFRRVSLEEARELDRAQRKEWSQRFERIRLVAADSFAPARD